MSEEQEIIILSLIEERKLDRKSRAEERRLNDLKLIESINRKTEDGLDPLQIFPYELWDKISRYVLDHENFENMSNTCSLFQQILEDRKMDIMFSKVLDIKPFIDELKSDSHNADEDMDDDLQDNDLWLELRLVCRSWRNIIDRQQSKMRLENKLSMNSLLGFKNSSLISEPSLNFAYMLNGDVDEDEKIFRSIIRALKLQETFNPDKPGAPKQLLHESLCVEIRSGIPLRADFTEFTQALTDALENVGGKIWNFFFVLHLTNQAVSLETLAQVYISFVKWTKLMPNLECLKVSLSWYQPSSDPVIDEVIRNMPFPTLKKLKQLDLTFGRNNGFKILEAILRSNQNIMLENLRIIEVMPEDQEENLQLIHSLNLRSFTYVNYCNDVLSLDMQVERLLNLNWSLKDIRLNISSEHVSYSNLFRTLGLIQTLETVSLRIPWRERKALQDADRDDEGLLELVNLTKFKINVMIWSLEFNNQPDWSRFSNFMSIDYLLKCRKLEFIDWSLTVYPTDKQNIRIKEEIAQFEEKWGKFANSSIWKVFPLLKNVTVNEGCFNAQIFQRPASLKY